VVEGPAPSHPFEWHFWGSPSSHPGSLTITIPPSRGVAFTQSRVTEAVVKCSKWKERNPMRLERARAGPCD
jgi:hypothetical protein